MKIGQGRENAKQYLEENPDVLAEVDAKIRAHYGLGASGETSDIETPETEETDGGKKRK